MSWYPLGGKGMTGELLNNPIITIIANKHHKSTAQVVLKWHVQMGFIVIPGSKNVDHIKDNINIFDFELDNEDMRNALTVFSRCFALAQENTPESRAAIIQELSTLKISDQEAIQNVKAQLDEFIKKQNENFVSILTKMQQMEDANKQIIENSEQPTEGNAEEQPGATPYE